MFKTCKRCGMIYDERKGHNCTVPKRDYKRDHANASKDRKRIQSFRWSKEWQRIREQIKQRDRHMCMYCWTQEHYVSVGEQLEVHHIVPLHEDWSKRADDNNLITLCHRHHRKADKGEIGRNILKNIIPPVEFL